MDSTRNMTKRIYRALLCASDQEIADGLAFYPGAYGLCRFLSRVANKSRHGKHRLHPRSVAGIYAALSPMNTWDTNVANILDVIRNGSSASVNTTDINLHKALTILSGVDPEIALSGRKVVSFYRCISQPDRVSLPPAIDRHLINLALGIAPGKNIQSTLAGDDALYSRVESAYVAMGQRADLHSLGNRLASIAWFVQRRVLRDGQAPILYPSRAVCCQRPAHSHGEKNYRCPVCKTIKRKIAPIVRSRRSTIALESLILDIPIPGTRSVIEVNGRPALYLGKGHRWANSAGFQFAARAAVMEETGEKLSREENVHHSDGDILNCRRNNLEVWLEEHHGSFHANRQLLYMLRDRSGRFAPSSVPSFSEMVPF